MIGRAVRAGGPLLCLAALLVAVSGCLSATDPVIQSDAAAAKARARIRLTEATGHGPFRIPYRDDEGRTATLTVAYEDGVAKVAIHNADGKVFPVDGLQSLPFLLMEYGPIDLYKPGQGEAVFLAMSTGGSGYTTTYLYVINPSRREAIWLGLTQAHSTAHPLTEECWSENASSLGLAIEWTFLDILKPAYGYMDEARVLKRADEPIFAPYFWWRDNDALSDGPMVIRRLKGPPDSGGATIEARLEDGRVTYTAFFKEAVWAYDAETDECFVVFHPHDWYCWPTALRKSGDWLCIATCGEGVALVNTRTWWLKRAPYDALEITAFEVRDNKAFINGKYEVELPTQAGLRRMR